MQRITSLFLALLLTCSLTACGSTAQPNPPAQTGNDASQTETPDTAPGPAEEPVEPQQEPYVISSPTVDRGTVGRRGGASVFPPHRGLPGAGL